jgi:hypothetical protein
LARGTAAADADDHVHVATMAGRFESIDHVHAVGFDGEVIFQGAIVDRDHAAAGPEANASHSRLAAASAEGVTRQFVFLRCNHFFYRSISVELS